MSYAHLCTQTCLDVMVISPCKFQFSHWGEPSGVCGKTPDPTQWAYIVILIKNKTETEISLLLSLSFLLSLSASLSVGTV